MKRGEHYSAGRGEILPFCILALALVGVAWIASQDGLGLFLRTEIQLEESYTKNQDAGAFRYKMPSGRREIPTHLIRELEVFERGRPLDEATSASAVKDSPAGLFAVSQNRRSLWVSPLFGGIEDLVMRYPTPVASWFKITVVTLL